MKDLNINQIVENYEVQKSIIENQKIELDKLKAQRTYGNDLIEELLILSDIQRWTLTSEAFLIEVPSDEAYKIDSFFKRVKEAIVRGSKVTLDV